MRPSAAKWALALVLGPALLVGMAGAQPGQPEDRPPARDRADQDRQDRQDMPNDPTLAKKFLERRLEETTKREEHLRALLGRLDKGEAPADVGKDFEPRRDGARRSADQDHADQRMARGPEHQGARAKLLPEDRDHAMQFFHENSPPLAARFEKLMKSDPEAADRILGHMLPRIREAEVAKGRNPGLFKLRLDEMEGGAALVDAMRAYREAKNATPQDAAKLGKATDQLRAALAHQLDNRLSVQENEIESLTSRLSDLKADLETKRGAKEATIDQMLAKVKDGKDARELAPGHDGDAGHGGPGDHPHTPGPDSPPGH